MMTKNAKTTLPTKNPTVQNARARNAGVIQTTVPNGAGHPDASAGPAAREAISFTGNSTRAIGALAPHGGTSETVRQAMLPCLSLDPDEADTVMRMLSERPDPDAAFETLFPILASRLDRDDEPEDARRECVAFAVSGALELARAVRRAGPTTLVRDLGPGWDLCARLNDAHERLGVLADRGNATAALVLDHIAPVVAECHAHAMEAAGVVKAEAADAMGVDPMQSGTIDPQNAHSAEGSTRSGATNATNMMGGGATVLRLVAGEDRS